MLQFTTRTTEVADTVHIVRNKFLRSLTPFEFASLKPYLRPVDLKKSDVIHQEGRPVEAVYFVESGVLSRTVQTKVDHPVEIAMVGNSGFVGLSVVLGTSVALHRTVVLVPGLALRISAQDIVDAMSKSPSIRETLLRYAQVLLSQNAQVSLCNAKHDLSSRLARWMLVAQDRLGEDTLPVTHDLLAMLLGVRRSGVSGIMQSFENDGVLKKGRGTLRIRSRELLQQRSCQCYGVIEEKSFWQKMPILHQHTFQDE